jgi:hypothetical protein
MIVINQKPNITHLPYTRGSRKETFAFVPGQNVISSDVWRAVREEAGDDRMQAHYNTFLKPIGEDDAGQEIDPGTLNADDFIDLIQGAMTLDLLGDYAKAENSRDGGPRKTVMAAIEKQAAEIEEIETKKNQGK